MKKFFVFALLFTASLVHAQTAALPIYACVLPGTQALVSGLKSSNYQYGIIPSCTVTVYLSGTTTIATTSPMTPRTANLDGSIPPIYAATGVAYDVKLSGGGGNANCTTAPNCYTTPVTLTGVIVGGGGGGGGIPWPTFTGLAKYGGSSSWVTPTYADVVALFTGGPCIGYLKSDGTCSIPGGYTLPIATTSILGGVKPDGTTTTVNPITGVLTAIGSGGSSPFPSSMNLYVEGASLDQSVDIQQDVIISASNSGSGYTAGATCSTSISGLTGTYQPTVGAVVDASGHVQWSLTYFGQGLTGTGTATVSGCGAGSAASATLTVPMTTCTTIDGPGNCYTNPWPTILKSLSAMNGRVGTFTNYAEGGSNVSDAISRATSNNYAALCSASGNQYFIVGGDLLFNSMSSYEGHPNLTAQVAYAQWISLVHYLKNKGCKVIVTTPNVGSTYAGGSGSSMNGTFVNRIQTAAQLIRDGVQGTDYDFLIDITSALQTNTDPTFVSFDNTHWTQEGNYMVAAFANGSLLAGGGPNLAPYYNIPVTFDNSGAVNWDLATCNSYGCFNIDAGDGVPATVVTEQSNQLSGWFFKDRATKTIQGHVGYWNDTGGPSGAAQLMEIGTDTSSTPGVQVSGYGANSWIRVTNQVILQ